jgi:hypothetical protein
MFDQVLSFLVDMKEIHLDKVYVINVLGTSKSNSH